METVFTQYAWLIPLIPLAAFLLLTALGRAYRTTAALLGTGLSLLALLLAGAVFLEQLGAGMNDYNEQFTWISAGEFQLTMGIEVTHLTSLMMLVVALVAFLVNVYSIGYMKQDERLTVFFSYMSLFSFSMLGLVLANNLLTLYIFWELVGLCSFLLIGFWYARPAARAAAKKAFIVTRIGDVGLLLAMLLLFWQMPGHTLSFDSIANVFSGQATAISDGMATLIALLIFLGAMGKSGQFPLHIWLPDAMEGPTPISALIHAATMVAAGVFLIARTYPIFLASPAAMDTVAYIGAFTALFAATIALRQNDLKRVLAYSTVSQLGYMMLALGLGSLTGGIFHLLTHAFFKALLFLCAGSIIHAAQTQNIAEMGGLGKRMKLTAWTFAIGALALSGIPPLSGFWSKDAILATALEQNPALFAVGVLAAFFTALYMARAFVLMFMGKPQQAASHAHDPQPAMAIPLVVLAVLAGLAGLVQLPWQGGDWLGSWLGDTASAHANTALVMIISTAAGALGLYLGYLVYGRGAMSAGAARTRPSWATRLLEREYYMNELAQALVVRPVHGLGRAFEAIDRYAVDGAVRLVAGAVQRIGRWNSGMQNGQVQTYGLIGLIALVLLLVAIAGRRFW